jgi:C-terminal processing protease CtpA/Prc
LLAAGMAALDPLLAAANGQQPEPADRAVWILRQLTTTQDLDERQRVLKQLVRVERRPQVVAEAKVALAEIQHDLAVRAIERLGGQFLEQGFDPHFEQPMPNRVVLDERWRGGDAGLEHLADLRDLPLVMIFGTDVSPQGLAQLAAVETLQRLQLYGTPLNEADVAKLQKALPGVTIDYFRGGLLGVHGTNNPQLAQVQSVQPDSAAAAAGIREGDIIRQFNGEQVASFEDLRSKIAKHGAGDEVTLEIVRGGKSLEVSAKLGRWKAF